MRAGDSPVLNLRPDYKELPGVTAAKRDLIRRLDHIHRQSRPGQPVLDARLHDYELAARMQLEATRALSVADETQGTLERYGIGERTTDGVGRTTAQEGDALDPPELNRRSRRYEQSGGRLLRPLQDRRRRFEGTTRDLGRWWKIHVHYVTLQVIGLSPKCAFEFLSPRTRQVSAESGGTQWAAHMQKFVQRTCSGSPPLIRRAAADFPTRPIFDDLDRQHKFAEIDRNFKLFCRRRWGGEYTYLRTLNFITVRTSVRPCKIGYL